MDHSTFCRSRSADVSKFPAPALQDVIATALPSCIVLVVCLSFFLTKAFTVDDIIFLRAAQQASRTPLTPFAYHMCWDGQVRYFSAYVANAPLMAYVLAPVFWFGRPEVAGHALQLLLLVGSTLGTASLALRFGLSRRAASLAAALTATCPAVIGMTTTVMPDVLAMALSTIAIERFVAWRQSGKAWVAVMASAALTLSPLVRPNLVLLFPTCMVLCVSRVSLDWLRNEWRRLLPGLALTGFSAAVYLCLLAAVRDPAAPAVMLRPGLLVLSPLKISYRVLSAGCFLGLTTPFAAGVLALMSRRFAWLMAILASIVLTVSLAVVNRKTGWIVAGSSALAYLALCWSLLQLWKIRSGNAVALALWVLMPFAAVTYLHMAAKFLVPSVPAYALILVLLVSAVTPVSRIWWTLPLAALVVGMLIAVADNQAANMARLVVERWIPAAETHRTFFMGQWGLQWYGELRHATCFDQSTHSAGDRVVVDTIGSAGFPKDAYPNARLLEVISNPTPAGVVLDRRLNAGFYSDGFGHLPWVWARAGTLRYELWEIH